MRRGRWIGGVAAMLLGLVGCSFDEASLLDPATTTIEAEVGQIRVLRYTDDPGSGDAWIDVHPPATSIVVESADFREDGDARDAGDEGRADRRRVFEATGAGSTLLIELNCVACAAGIPSVPADEVEVQVWHFVVDEGGPLSLGSNVALLDEVRSVAVGEYVVVVRPGAEGPGDVRALDSTILRPIGGDDPNEGPDLFVDLYLALEPGDTEIRYELEDGTSRTYLVSVR